MEFEDKTIVKKRKFAVLQIGARMHYAIPSIFVKNKRLAMFYTDIHSNHFFFNILKLIIPKQFRPLKLKNLLARKLPTNLSKKFVKDFPLLSIIFYSNPEKKDNIVLDRALKDKFSGADAIYTNFINDDIEHIKKAKDLGIYIVHEMIIAPDSGLIMYEENKAFPNISLCNQKLEDIERGIILDKIKWDLSDKVLVPSKYCKESAISMGAKSEKLFLVNYGINKDFFNFNPNPQHYRILFVGEVSLRKGSHYFAQASRILSARGKKYNFVAAGSIKVDINNSLFNGVTYLGHVPRNEMINQYLNADIFVLPSLVEGMAIAHLEAMAFGLPVITTPNCGSIISNSKEGFIIPIRDPEILASRIEEIVEDRDLRKQMSIKSKKIARNYTWDRYSKNLKDVLDI